MKELINAFGEKNITIICAVIAAIILALLVIIIIEKIADYKKKKNVTNDSVLPYIENDMDKVSSNEFEQITEEKSTNTDFEEPNEKDEIVYVETKETKEDAKKAIEEAAKKLAYEENHNLVGPTFFERVQEEKSIISYDELLKSNIDTDKENDIVLSDEGNEPITIDELYRSQLQDIIKETTEVKEQKNIETKEENQIIIEDKKISEPSNSKKFKNSDIISPVFGVKRDVVYQKEYNELGQTVNIKELDDEIAKTEEFLNQLKQIKDKLD